MLAPSESRWPEGWYFDGHSSGKRAVSVEVFEGGIRIREGTAQPVEWARGSYRLDVDPHHRWARAERLPCTGESVLVEDESFARAVADAPAWQRLFAPESTGRTAGLTLLTALILAGVYFGYSRVADAAAEALPESAERRMGSWVAASLAPASNRLPSDDAHRALASIAARLDRTGAWHLAIQREKIPNAWAAPGRYITIHDSLICALNSPDELAAVLGHEMSHVHRRHGTKRLFRLIGERFALTLVLGGGDPTVDTAALLGALHYMRADEEDADRGDFDLLTAAQVDPMALARAFENLEASMPAKIRVPAAMRYLSSHPPTQERRAAAAQRAARVLAPAWQPVLDAGRWEKLRRHCGCPEGTR